MKYLFVGLIALTVLGYGGFLYWQTTPEYSLLKIQEAIETKDSYLFKKHVDVENLIERTIDKIFENSIAKREKEPDKESSFPNLSSGVAEGIIEAIKPVAINFLTNEIEKYIEGESADDSTSNGLLSLPAFEKFDVRKIESILSSAQKKYLTKEEKVALLGLEFEDAQGELRVIEFKLRKFEDYWRLTELSNFDDIFDSFPNE